MNPLTQAAVAPKLAPAIGTPVYNSAYGKAGFVARLDDISGAKIYTLGTGAMVKQNLNFLIVWDNLDLSEVSEGIAQPWLDRAAARGDGYATPETVLNMVAQAQFKRLSDRAALATEQADGRVALEAFRAKVRPLIPADAKAVILATLVSDRSDSQSDYFGSTTTRTVILGFSSHTRNLFPELRKLARNFPETASLADAPESAEHRENWSMGGGMYLKDSYRHDDGWKVHKDSFYGSDPVDRLPIAELALTAPAPVSDLAPVQAAPGGGFTLQEVEHTKRNCLIWLAVPAARADRDTYDSQLAAAKALGGWYSRAWGRTPGGFAFLTQSAALAFTGAETPENGASTAESAPRDIPAPVQLDRAIAGLRPGAGPIIAAGKLDALAEGMQGAIDNAFRDRLANTPKRQREAASARQEGNRLTRAQAGLRALADLHRTGTVPPVLAGVKSKATAYDLAREEIDHSRGGYYSAGQAMDRPAHATPESLAFWALLEPKTAEEIRADMVRAKLQEVNRVTIPGYFPTPAALVSRMLDSVPDLAPGSKVLEPSAGSGAILDGLQAACPGVILTAYEINSRLRELLELKGYPVAGGDFTEATPAALYDAVVMNPPFEQGQDVAHVRRAFDHVKPGGVLVSIMAPGWQFNGAAKFAAFRDWLAGMPGQWESEAVEAGAFKESGTGVATVILTIRKGA